MTKQYNCECGHIGKYSDMKKHLRMNEMHNTISVFYNRKTFMGINRTGWLIIGLVVGAMFFEYFMGFRTGYEVGLKEVVHKSV